MSRARWVVVWWHSAAQDVEVIGPFRSWDRAYAMRDRIEKYADETRATVVALTAASEATVQWVKDAS